MQKTCFKCNQSKPLNSYYKHKQMRDGHLNKCKSCTKKDSKEREKKLRLSDDWVKSERQRQREKYFRLDYKEKQKPEPYKKSKYELNHRAKFPEKYKARILSQRVLSNGKERHHWSYKVKDAKSVILLTPKEHAKAHRFLDYDQSEFKYRDEFGNLLKTKEQHEQYIKNKIATEPD